MMFDFRRNLEHAERLAHNVRMADRWHDLAADETRVTRCVVCRDALTAGELRAGLSVCLCCEPDRLACPSCHEPTVDGRFCTVCLDQSSSPGDASGETGGSGVLAAAGSVAGSTPLPTASPATGPRTERTTK